MIEVNLLKCTGCGRCVDVCPAGAMQVVAGHARVDAARCQGCEACVGACPEGALSVVAAPVTPVSDRPLRVRPDVVIEASPKRGVQPWHRRLLPALGTLASFTAREVLPRVLEYVASLPAKGDAAGSGKAGVMGQGPTAGQRHRHRRRGG
ncbi:MAG: 4Fe-4S binding protein [Anaerolineae bacterium]|nr:4Fe-4S binding protein [Anaerolineae bacterium]